MPTYEYACSACGHAWEETQRITEAPLDTCPACAKPTAHRLISGGTHFILKGGGWYSDLYASPKPSGSKAGGTSESKSESTAGSSESKPAASEPGKTAPAATGASASPSSTSATST